MNIFELLAFLSVTATVGALVGGGAGLFAGESARMARIGALAGPLISAFAITLWVFVSRFKGSRKSASTEVSRSPSNERDDAGPKSQITNVPKAESVNGPRLREWLRPLLLTALCVGAIVWLIVSWKHITSTRVVTHATMPNGVEIMIRQSFTWNGDLFNTSFHYRRPGGQWIWPYYSHEDFYWGHGRVDLDAATRIATIFRGGQPTIKFNWDTLAHTQFTDTQGGTPRTFTP